VLESDQASKPAALRRAEAVASAFPRIFLDADVVLSGPSAAALIEALTSGDRPAGRPRFRYDTQGASAPVRAYYRARMRAPSVLSSLWGAGVYGLGADGRARFGEFPDVTAEDLFVDSLFDRSEIVIVDTDPVVVTTPRRSRDLLNVLRRAYRGTRERPAVPDVPARSPVDQGGDVVRPSRVLREVAGSARSVSSALDAVVYIGFAIAARVLVRLRPAPRWERDESSRGG
jgi:hypothetical protein